LALQDPPATAWCSWDAEDTPARASGPHYARAEDEAHILLAEAVPTSADLRIIGDELHVSFESLAEAARTPDAA
jgi:hypothetical protein